LDERQQLRKIERAKTALFDFLRDKYPAVAHIEVTYSGSGDEGCIDEVYLRGRGGEKVEARDPNLDDLVEALFSAVTPAGFGINDGGDGEISVDVAARKILVDHRQNIVHREEDTYEV
jgi:hypothetical protein